MVPCTMVMIFFGSSYLFHCQISVVRGIVLGVVLDLPREIADVVAPLDGGGCAGGDYRLLNANPGYGEPAGWGG